MSIIDPESYIKNMLHRPSLFFSNEELEKIRNTTIAIAGLGGVGAITAELFARWGIKRFRLMDKDKYEPTNLNRQLLATAKTLGQYKVTAATERIKEINPYCEIEMTIKEAVNNENVHPFIKNVDLLIQTTDSPSSLLYYKMAQQFKIPLINGYTYVTGGYVTIYDFRISNCYSLIERIKDSFKWRNMKQITEMAPQELKELDQKWGHSTAANLNFVTNIAGCLIVSEAIKLLIGHGKVIKFPYQIEFDLFKTKLKRKKIHSIFDRCNYKKLINLFKHSNV